MLSFSQVWHIRWTLYSLLPELIFGIEGKNFRVGIKQSYFSNLVFALKCIGYSVPAELQFQCFWIGVVRGSKGAPNTVLLGKLLLTGLSRRYFSIQSKQKGNSYAQKASCFAFFSNSQLKLDFTCRCTIKYWFCQLKERYSKNFLIAHVTCMNKVLSSIFEKQITFTILPRLKEMEFRIQFASQRFLNRREISSTAWIINSKVKLVTLSFTARSSRKTVPFSPSTVLIGTKRCSFAVAYFSAKVWLLQNGNWCQNAPLENPNNYFLNILCTFLILSHWTWRHFMYLVHKAFDLERVFSSHT